MNSYCDEEPAPDDCNNNGGGNSTGSFPFGSNPDDPDACEGELGVNGEETQTGGNRNDFATYSFQTRMELTPQGILTTRLTGNVILARQLSNGFGETLREDTPNSYDQFISTHYSYNIKGQLIHIQTEEMAPTLFEYDAMGHKIKQTLALGNPPTPHNSRVTEMSYMYAAREDGIYHIQTTVTYNQNGSPLTEKEEELVSTLSPLLESKNRSQDMYGNISEYWSEYAAPGRRMQYGKVPTSTLVATSTIIDSWEQEATDHAGITTTRARSYTAEGTILSFTDGRGNTTRMTTDLAGRTIQATDASGATTTTAYDPCFDLPSCMTNALGHTTCYTYDIRGRKTAEYGTAIQPACFGYDEADRMVSLTTFRNPGEKITSDPRGRTDGDTTRWTYDEKTGLQREKIYSDGSKVIDGYGNMNRLTSRTLARGIIISYTYDHLTGDLTYIYYLGASPSLTYYYNHLGQLTAIETEGEEDHPIRLYYDEYGKLGTTNYWLGDADSNIMRVNDSLGRPRYFSLDLPNQPFPQYWENAYDEYGRIDSCTLLSNESTGTAEKSFQFHYLPGSHLVSSIGWSNGLSLEYTYEQKRNLLTGITCSAPENASSVCEKTRILDSIGRPESGTNRRQNETTRDDSFRYNTRNELVHAALGETLFQYEYDNIGNREQALEELTQTDYVSNSLNQYTSIEPSDETSFIPAYDADGNQTRIRTTTGIWNIAYDANNRPVQLNSEDGKTVIECRYDYMGRRLTKKVTVQGTVTLHEGYHYLDYLQIAAVNLLADHEILHITLWNPVAPVATRPLVMIRGNDAYYTVHDFVKNVTEWIDEQGNIAASFDYTPTGHVFQKSGDTSLNTIGYSSEIMDHELGLVYYNYRHLNPLDGRWISRDPLQETDSLNIYVLLKNKLIVATDYLGAMTEEECLKGVKEILKNTSGYLKASITEIRNDKKCSLPPIYCVCRSEQNPKIRGAHFRDKNKIEIYYKSIDSQESLITVITHEYIHAYQNCKNKKSELSCSESIKRELAAYAQDGGCSKYKNLPALFDECVKVKATGSSKKFCRDDENYTRQMVDIIYPKIKKQINK